MIRELNLSDINRIDEIGSLIKEDFVKKYDIQNFINFDYGHIYVYEEDIIKGFIQVEEHFEILDLINIAVDKKYQGEDIGTKLIEYIINNLSAEKIMLEVRESNKPAINLYKKMNFKEINRRRKYYDNEDAIIMERNLI